MAGESTEATRDAGERGPLWKYVLVAVGLTVLGIVANVIGSLPGFLVGQDTLAGFALLLVGSELGFVVAGLVFLVATGRGLGYLDLDLPESTRTWGVVVGLAVGAFVVRTVVIVGALSAGIEPSASTITQVDIPTRTLLIFLIPAFLLVVGPAEELLFRGVIQKYLREAFSANAAIVGAGLLFGVIHVFALVESTGLGTLVSVVVITLVGLAIGWLYEYTGSLPAAMIAHGTYNALIAASALAVEVLA